LAEALAKLNCPGLAGVDFEMRFLAVVGALGDFDPDELDAPPGCCAHAVSAATLTSCPGRLEMAIGICLLKEAACLQRRRAASCAPFHSVAAASI
jgi:hypothetical protein